MTTSGRDYRMTPMMRKTAELLASSMRRLNKTAELLDASRMFLNHWETLNGQEHEEMNGSVVERIAAGQPLDKTL